MKTILLTLLIGLLICTSCKDNDDKGGEGYLTSIDSVNSGIIGVWKPSNEIYYYGFDSQRKKCSGFKPDELTHGCGRYQILGSNGEFVLRIFGIDDLDGTGSFIDYVLLTLNGKELIYKNVKSGDKAYFTRVK